MTEARKKLKLRKKRAKKIKEDKEIKHLKKELDFKSKIQSNDDQYKQLAKKNFNNIVEPQNDEADDLKQGMQSFKNQSFGAKVLMLVGGFIVLLFIVLAFV